jgi:hypothetical protein
MKWLVTARECHNVTAGTVEIPAVLGHDVVMAEHQSSRIGDGVVDVAALALSMGDQCARNRPGLRVSVDVPGEIWVPADPDLIRRSWQGYCDAMADRLRLAGSLWITAAVDPEASRVHIVAEDDGPAIAAEVWAEVWLPGLRDGAHSGSQVATLLAIDEIRGLGGDVSVGSGAVGTSVTMSLPTTTRPAR